MKLISSSQASRREAYYNHSQKFPSNNGQEHPNSSENNGAKPNTERQANLKGKNSIGASQDRLYENTPAPVYSRQELNLREGNASQLACKRSVPGVRDETGLREHNLADNIIGTQISGIYVGTHIQREMQRAIWKKYREVYGGRIV